MKELNVFNVQRKSGTEQQSPNKKERDGNQQIIHYVHMGKKGI